MVYYIIMVNNHCIVLDEGIEKNIKEVIVPMFDEDIRARWYTVSNDCYRINSAILKNMDDMDEHKKNHPKPTYIGGKGDIMTNHCFDKQKEKWDSRHCELHDTRKDLLNQIKRLDPDDWISNRPHWGVATNKERMKQYEYAHKYFNIEKFIPFICINVSPNWQKIDHSGKPSEKKKQVLHTAIRKFGECSKRFTELHYVLECGGEGNHLHAHIVAKINPDMEKTVITQMRKGNLSRSFRKFFNQSCKEHEFDAPPKYHETKWYQKEGMGGIVEGKFAVQFSLMRKKEFWQDKLDYLIEDRKPEDHKNAYVLEEKRVIYF